MSPLAPAPRTKHAGQGTKLTGLRPALRWPLPALLCWAGAWAAWAGLQAAGMPAGWATALALAGNSAASALMRPRWRGLIVALGWPLSLALLTPDTQLPAWGWLLLLLTLAGLYPLRAWHDAPWFPTPAGALTGLAALTPWPAGLTAPRILDAGCGQGAGLTALRGEYPAAQLVGIEWSRWLCWLCAWRCRWAEVRRADLWADSWAGYDLVYLFQRPESLPRALDKARREMRPGSWLASLEFAHPAQPADAVLQAAGRRPVWLYRCGAAPSRASAAARRKRPA